VKFECSNSKFAFTMMELILVMAILTIAVSLTAPALANFFRGRSLDSEARRLLAMTRLGQSRAASEGIPMELWFDVNRNAFGLEAEPSYEATDGKAEQFTLDADMQMEVFTGTNSATLAPALANPTAAMLNATTSSGQSLSRHPDLPTIRFLPDGSMAETSPQALKLTGRDGLSIWVAQTRNRLSYEVRNRLD
jgi:prepilin-type N-terminal cleavage/methylation domain-containing protein